MFRGARSVMTDAARLPADETPRLERVPGRLSLEELVAECAGIFEGVDPTQLILAGVVTVVRLPVSNLPANALDHDALAPLQAVDDERPISLQELGECRVGIPCQIQERQCSLDAV